jgi:ubiquitin conjugation factor E4 B
LYREMQKMVDDLEKSEPVWKNHPSAARNRALLKKWKEQLKRQSRSKACSDVGLLDEVLFNRCLNFYSRYRILSGSVE